MTARKRGATIPGVVVRYMIRASAVASLMTVCPMGGAVAQTADTSDDSTWVSETIPESKLSLRHPANWAVLDVESDVVQESFEAAEAMGADVVLSVADEIRGDGATALKAPLKKTMGRWYADFAEYKKYARASAKSSDGRMLEAGKKTIAQRPAYWHLERFLDGPGDMLYAEVHIRTGKDEVLTIATSVNASTPHARAIATSIIDDVQAS